MESEKTLRKSSSFCWDKKHLPPTIGWPCWNGNICRVHSLPCYWLWCLKSSRYVTDKIICRRSMRKGLMAAITLKLHVAQVKDGGEQFKNLPGICLWEGEDLQSWAEVSKLLYVVSPFTACAVSLMEGVTARKAKYSLIHTQRSHTIKQVVYWNVTVPWSDTCNQLLCQEKESSSGLLTCPSACSKRCGSFFPQAPIKEVHKVHQQDL